MNKTALKIGERIKARRADLGISQRGLAEKADIFQSQISRYEKGEAEPTATVLMLLAQALETSADWLLGLSEIESFQTEGDLNSLERQALTLFRNNPPERQLAVIEILRLV